MEKVSIVVPVYNSEKSLIELSHRVKSVFRNIEFDYELLFIDDCSPNKNTWIALKNIQKEDDCVKIVQLMRNFGQQSATLCGMEMAIGDYVITMDDDLQHSPEDMSELLKERKHDVVIGQFKNKKHSLFKRFMSRLKGLFDRIITGKPKDIHLSAFRLIRKNVVDAMLKIKTSYPFISAMMFYVSKDVKGVWVTHSSRKEGRSSYNFWKMSKLFSNLLINNSSLLLRFMGVIGFFAIFSSIGLGIYFIFKRLSEGTSVPGWTSLMLVTIFGMGFIIFMLGIIGEYLIRIISSTEYKPIYIVRHKIDN